MKKWLWKMLFIDAALFSAVVLCGIAAWVVYYLTGNYITL